MTNATPKLPKPPAQRIGRTRVKLIIYASVAAAVALTVFDAKVSYDGFKSLSLAEYVPIVLAGLIFLVQLCAGALQQLGMNPFYGVGGSPLLDFVWRWVLAGVYVLDVGSNAIAFNMQRYLTIQALRSAPVDSITMAVILLLLACLLTFGDEILLRLVDRLLFGSKANEVSAMKLAIDVEAYNRFLAGYKANAIAKADAAAEHAVINYEWLRDNTQ